MQAWRGWVIDLRSQQVNGGNKDLNSISEEIWSLSLTYPIVSSRDRKNQMQSTGEQCGKCLNGCKNCCGEQEAPAVYATQCFSAKDAFGPPVDTWQCLNLSFLVVTTRKLGMECHWH